MIRTINKLWNLSFFSVILSESFLPSQNAIPHITTHIAGLTISLKNGISAGIKIKKHKSPEKEPLTDKVIEEVKKLSRNDFNAFMMLFLIYTLTKKIKTYSSSV